MPRPKHSDPKRPRVRPWHGQNIITSATAPYNFVPLPHRIALIDEPLHQDTYKDNGLTGYIECKITTESPTYIRGMLDIEQYKQLQDLGQEIQTKPEEKEKLAKFFSTSKKKQEGLPLPSIPGSSLRGMLRNLVEIISYSRIHAVADDPQIWYRDVAGNSAMKESYRKIIGNNGAKVRAGFLSREGDRWVITPAPLPKEKDDRLCDKSYCKVHENIIQTCKDEEEDILVDFITLYEDGYKLQKQPYKIRFSVEVKQIHGQNENIVTKLIQFTGNEDKYDHTGYLICTGNMGDQGRRKYYPVILASDPSENEKRIFIEENAVKLYKHNLTDKLKKDLEGNGCLHEGNVVFYAPLVNKAGEIVYFGHNPYFRVPLRNGSDCISPWDYTIDFRIPESKVDYVEAIFGADLEAKSEEQNLGPAGRVSFMNAEIDLDASADRIWYRQPPRPEAPKILASPKATAYAHYLVQDRSKGYDPDGDRRRLANYNTLEQKTEIRGHKLFWAKGANPEYTANEEDLRDREKTLTRVITLNKGVVFKTKIKFHNLREEELGALLWALTLPGEEGHYRHRIGMGKPLGMGVIHIESEIFITDKVNHYQKLFEQSDQKSNWYVPSQKNEKLDQYLDSFEDDIIKQIREKKKKLSDVERIRDLLCLLRWQSNVNQAWREETEYMELEKFRELAVLPTPKKVIDCAKYRSEHNQSRHTH